jgi:hypothetical protein
MKIGIVDADLIHRKKHRFPNLACMKLSSYYKQNGHEVTLLTTYDDVESYDKVFISKVFTDTEIPAGITELSWVEYGGTGFFYDKAPALPDEIEHTMPDYHLYDDFVNEKIQGGESPRSLQFYTDFSIGFATRGCVRGCSFCVNKNYKMCSLHSPISEFLDEERKHILLLDDNVLSCKDWKSIFEELNATGKRFQFKQGMDERLLTPEKCEVIFNSNWYGDYIFAFDNIKDRRIVEKKLNLIREHTDKIVKFYCFCAYNHDDPDHYSRDFWKKDVADLFERIKILMEHRFLPYIMRYADYVQSPYKGVYVTIARWCNQPAFFKKKSFREFCEADQSHKKNQSTLCSSMRALKMLETECPDIVKKYCDMKWR